MVSKTLWAGAGAAALLIAGCAGEAKVSGGSWGGSSTPAADYTPSAAAALGQEGWVMLDCIMAEGRRAERCRIAQEYPTGWGYGDAALRLREGVVVAEYEPVAVGGEFRLPVAFCLERSEKACELDAIRGRMIAHRAKLGPLFPGEEPIPEVLREEK